LLEGEGPSRPEVYLRDLATGVTELVSRVDGPGGAFAQGVDSAGTDVSADGRRVVFATADGLVPADVNGQTDVYVRDLVAESTTLVSVGASGDGGDAYSDSPSMSDDGMRVAFRSQATNLLDAGPVTGVHIYVRDLLAGTTVLADRDAQS